MSGKSIKELEKEWSALVDAFLESQDGRLLIFNLSKQEFGVLSGMLKGYAHLLVPDNPEALKYFESLRREAVVLGTESIGSDKTVELRLRVADLARRIVCSRPDSAPDPLETKPAPPGWEKALPTSSPPVNYSRIVTGSALRGSSVSGLMQLLGSRVECLPQSSALHSVSTSTDLSDEENPTSTSPQDGDDPELEKT
jgi:hypothetical protein